MTEKKEKAWFADGEAYDHYVGRWSRPVGQMFLDWLAPAPGLRWADVGCGTGALTEAILSSADPERVIGVEPSEGFLTLHPHRNGSAIPCSDFRLFQEQGSLRWSGSHFSPT